MQNQPSPRRPGSENRPAANRTGENRTGGNRPTASREPARAPNRAPAAGGRPNPSAPRPAGAYRPENRRAVAPARADLTNEERTPKRGVRAFLRSPLGVTTIILGSVLVILLAVFLGLRIAGYRYLSYDFVEQLTGRKYSVRYLGKTDKEENPLDGVIHYADGDSASVASAPEVGGFRIEYKNGDVYEGAMSKLQRHGKGKLTFSSGDVYEGDFAYDELSGEGVFSYATGDRYEGSYLSGKKNGYGMYTWAADADGRTASYAGYFASDLREGEGTFTYADGSVYQGSFVKDKKEDVSGTLTLPNGDSYVGEFHEDRREGHGEYRYANGDVYTGEFKDGLPDGEGTYVFADGRTYHGGFTKGEIDAAAAGFYTSGDAASSASG